MIRVHLKITGRVQGVFYRATSCDKARELRVTGWVANEADGSVAAVVEGPENLVNEFIDWCRGGPSNAEVEKVEVEQCNYTGEFEDFDIRY